MPHSAKLAKGKKKQKQVTLPIFQQGDQRGKPIFKI
jgi:hypothetical protein